MSFYFCAPYDFRQTPVTTFHENVRLNGLNKGQRSGLIKYSYVADALQSRQEHAALSFRQNGPLRALQFSDGPVAVYSNYQRITQPPSFPQVADVPSVQNVETPIGEDDPLPGVLQFLNPSNQGISFEDFFQMVLSDNLRAPERWRSLCYP